MIENYVHSIISHSENGAFIYSEDCNVIIQKIFFREVDIKKIGGLILGLSCTVKIFQDFVIFYDINAIYLLECNLSLLNSTFNNLEHHILKSETYHFQSFGTLAMRNFYYAIIENCVFMNNGEIQGGAAIFLYSFISYKTFVEITKSIFFNNKVFWDGGSIYSLNVIIKISQSIFNKNYAGETGGAIYFDSSESNYIYN